MIDEEAIRNRFDLLSPYLDEKTRRLMAATEAQVIWVWVNLRRGAQHRHVPACHQSGYRRAKAPAETRHEGIRRPGGGRKKAVDVDPTLKRIWRSSSIQRSVEIRSRPCGGPPRVFGIWLGT